MEITIGCDGMESDPRSPHLPTLEDSNRLKKGFYPRLTWRSNEIYWGYRRMGGGMTHKNMNNL